LSGYSEYLSVVKISINTLTSAAVWLKQSFLPRRFYWQWRPRFVENEYGQRFQRVAAHGEIKLEYKGVPWRNAHIFQMRSLIFCIRHWLWCFVSDTNVWQQG
jgi:hypothetical protein